MRDELASIEIRGVLKWICIPTRRGFSKQIYETIDSRPTIPQWRRKSL